MKRLSQKILQGVVFAALVMAAAPSVQGATLAFEVDRAFRDTAPAHVDAPWVRAVFDERNEPGSALLTPARGRVSEQVRLTDWYFRFESSTGPLTGSRVEPPDPMGDESEPLSRGKRTPFQAGDPALRFHRDRPADILSGVRQQGQGRFGSGNRSIFEILGDCIRASSFDHLGSERRRPSFFEPGRIQEILEGSNPGGWMRNHGWNGNPAQGTPAPEPATMLLVGAGMLMLGGWVRNRRNR